MSPQPPTQSPPLPAASTLSKRGKDRASRPAAPPAKRVSHQDAARELESGIETLGVEIPPCVRHRMLEFVVLLERWNQAYNLTRIVGLKRMVSLHLLDTLTALPFLRGSKVCDLGTGPGVPGIVLACTLPESKFLLLDGNAKKTRFCQQAVSALGLENVEVVHTRAETFERETRFDTVIARAVAPLVSLARWSAHLGVADARLVVMKGKVPHVELEELGPMRQNTIVTKVQIPGVRVERHIVTIDGLGSTQWQE